MTYPLTRYRTLISALAVLFCIVYTQATFAQKIDSLQRTLAGNLPDTTRVRLLAQLAHSYRDANLDSMAAIARRGMAFADHIHFEDGKADCMKELGTSYSAINQYDTTLAYYRQCLTIYERTGNLVGQRETIQSMANIYSRQLRYSMAIEYHEKSMALSQQLNDANSVGQLLVKIGTDYSELGNYPESIKHYLDGLKIFEKQNNNAGILMCLTSIANVYALVGDNKKAIDYVKLSLAIQNGKGSKHDIISFYVDIGAVYTMVKDNGNGLLYFGKALHLADSIGDDYWKNISLVDIGETYYQMGNLDSALVKYLECVKNLEATNDEYISITAKAGIGKVLIRKGNVQGGIAYLLQSYTTAKDNGMKDAIAEDAEELSNAYETISTYDKALAFRKICEAYKDSLFNEKSERHIQQLQFDYQLEKNKTIARNKSEKQTTIILSMMAGLALFSIIIVLLYKSRQREKANKEKSMAQANEIQLQATKLEELNSFKDKTFSVLSHDLRGPLGAFTSAMSMLDKHEISQEEFNGLKPEVNRQLNSLNLLLENLLNWSKSHMQGGDTIYTEPVHLHQIAKNNIALIHNAATNKGVTIHNNIPAGAIAMADEGQVDIVIRNLVNNAVKFTKAGGTITLSAREDDKNMSLDVKDTGVGMSQQQLDKLFKVVTKNSTYGTGGEKGIGLGLLLCYEFIKANNGTITATSQQGQGSTFTVTLPKG